MGLTRISRSRTRLQAEDEESLPKAKPAATSGCPEPETAEPAPGVRPRSISRYPTNSPSVDPFDGPALSGFKSDHAQGWERWGP